MPKTKRRELTSYERGVIVGCRISGRSIRDISSLTGHPKSTVQEIVQKYEKEGATSAAPRSGRPRILSDRDRRVIVRTVKETPKTTLQNITAALTVERSAASNHSSRSRMKRAQSSRGSAVKRVPSSRTVRRALHELGFFGRPGRDVKWQLRDTSETAAARHHSPTPTPPPHPHSPNESKQFIWDMKTD